MKLWLRTAVILVVIACVSIISSFIKIKAPWSLSSNVVHEDIRQNSTFFQTHSARKLRPRRKFMRRQSELAEKYKISVSPENVSIHVQNVTNAGLNVHGIDEWTWPNLDANQIQAAIGKVEEMCTGSFIGYDHSFALLNNVTVDPKFGHGRKGGENISDVINQREDLEYHTLEKGYFKLRCQEGKPYHFKQKSHLNNWFNALDFYNQSTKIISTQQRFHMTAIAIKRFEYANLYHTMTDFYNAFLVAKVLKLAPDHVTVFIVDGHPAGALDDTWSRLFGGMIRAGEITEAVTIQRMVWSTIGYDSMLNSHHLHQVPFLEEFRSFFLSRHSLHFNDALDCDNLTVVLLLRKDYLAHPRNPSGSVSRKIANDKELVQSLKEFLPQHNVISSQIDLFSMKDQLSLISRTDILIGMHGAGLTHTLFLPKHAGLIELYPNYWPTANVHFQAMARWRNLKYLQWQNTDPSNEHANEYTVINKSALVGMVKNMHSSICS